MNVTVILMKPVKQILDLVFFRSILGDLQQLREQILKLVLLKMKAIVIISKTTVDFQLLIFSYEMLLLFH